jgi:ribonuclease J
MVGDIEIEFVPITHSILQSVLVVVRGDDKTIVFASDFKIDEKPLLGYKTDSSRLKKLRDEGIFAAFVGAVRVNEPGPTPSESRAREMLRDVMRKADSDSNSILVTTFSSHIARIKSIVDISFEIGRTPVVLGRSLHEYCSTASRVGLVDFPPELHIHGRPNAVRNVLREVEKFRGEYVLILTGHQGEPTSLLTRISDRDLPFKVREGDEIIFSASVIPNPMNESNRRILEAKLLAQGAHIYRDVHVSGHAGRKDTKEFIKMLCPEHLIPCHGTEDGLKIVADIGREIGYSKDQIHMLHNGEKLRLGI